jgi:hypothetical protein
VSTRLSFVSVTPLPAAEAFNAALLSPASSSASQLRAGLLNSYGALEVTQSRVERTQVRRLERVSAAAVRQRGVFQSRPVSRLRYTQLGV